MHTVDCSSNTIGTSSSDSSSSSSSSNSNSSTIGGLMYICTCTSCYVSVLCIYVIVVDIVMNSTSNNM